MLYFILAGIERFSIEFIRLNDRLLFGLTEAQLISVLLIIIGTIGFYYFTYNKDVKKFIPQQLNSNIKKMKHDHHQPKH
jgi:prolipoprotein diacylglyceryltransferase